MSDHGLLRQSETQRGPVATLVSAPLSVRFAFLLGLLCLMAVLDFVTGPEISFSIFYLVPVVFAGAFVSRRAGIIMAVASAVMWGYFDVTTGPGYSASWIPYWNSAMRLGFFLLVNELIRMLQREHAVTQQLSRTDPLTGIANARVFTEHAERAIAQSRRDGRPFTIAFVDLDRFKAVNDEFGHSEGDRLLKTVATLIGSGLRTTDVVARLGGDEFGILMPEAESEQALASLERIASAIAEDIGTRWPVGATFGAVTFRESPDDVDSAVRQADALMYQGKAGGRGRIVHAIWPEPAAGVSE